MMADVQPAAVIHTAAITDLDFCEQFPDDSLPINLHAPINLAALCGDKDIPFVFTSADLVFDGARAPYAEDDPPTPINVFGEHKALAEEGHTHRLCRRRHLPAAHDDRLCPPRPRDLLP